MEDMMSQKIEEKANTTIKTDKVDLIRFDWAMKKMLRNKANFDVLEGFLSSLLKDDIVILEILESESNQEDEKAKFNRVDLLVKDSKEKKIIVEIQNDRESDYLERIVFGASKKIIESVELGNSFKKIAKVISISILYFNLGRGDDYIYHGTTVLKGIHTGHPLLIKEKAEAPSKTYEKQYVFREKDVFPEYYFLNIKKFQNEIIEDADEWIYFFKNNEILDSFHSKNIQIAKEKFNILKMNKDELKRYENFLINLMSEEDIIDTAKEDGREEGREEGRVEGREEGAKDKALKIAKKMLKKNMSVGDIIEMTGLTKQEIEKLKQS